MRSICDYADVMQLQEDVLSFSPPVNILLLGSVNSGKSSIVSTTDSFSTGRSSRIAPRGQGRQGSGLTTQLRKYSFQNRNTGQHTKWKLWDSMGWDAHNYRQMNLPYILDGSIPDKCMLDTTVSARTPDFNASPSLREAVHCVCVVVPCDLAKDEAYLRQLRETSPGCTRQR